MFYSKASFNPEVFIAEPLFFCKRGMGGKPNETELDQGADKNRNSICCCIHPDAV
jgi:hypothetical protein